MRQNLLRILILIPLFLSLSVLLSNCGSPISSTPGSTTSETTSTSSDSLDGKALMQERCSTCHTTGRITSKSASLEEWTATVDRMISKGTQLDTVERENLIQFLAQTYP